MIIEIVGKQGAGKTALNTLFELLEERYNGKIMLGQCNRIITEINKTRAADDKIPICTKAPIYGNYESRLSVGYKKEFVPFVLDPYLLGVPTEKTADKIQYILPCSCLHITEGRKYWDGRESSTMPDNVSQWFETHRHNYMTIIIDAQRGNALDLNIRANANLFIEVQGMYNEEDAYGKIISSTWYCKEFYSLQDYEGYLAGKQGVYWRNTTHYYKGNIFESFASRNRMQDFIPPKKVTYSMVDWVGESEIKQLPPQTQELFKQRRPEWYRQKVA